MALAGRAYDIQIGSGLLASAGDLIAPALRRPFAPVVTDEIVAKLHLPALQRALASAGVEHPCIVLPAGEQTKSFTSLAALCDQLLSLGVDRQDHLIALGGGVIGDLVGFAAAIIMRGVDFIQIPTTLLAQVDSSVGGKTAIDTPRGKNLIGAFHQPRMVLADLSVLGSLPAREMVCGYAEVIKYALLGDAGFFAWLEENGAGVLDSDPAAIEHAVARCVQMKAEIVAQDEREAGARALLNLGHTFGHGFEALLGYAGALKHGEAVGLGCALAFRFSQALGLCAPADSRRVEAALGRAGLPLRLADLPGGCPAADALVEAMRQDKKASAGRLTFILVRGIGQAFVASDVPAQRVRDFLLAEGALA